MEKTAKVKAKELVDRMYLHTQSAHSKDDGYLTAKHCAIIEVEELKDYAKSFGDVTEQDIKYFNDVQTEIEKL